MDKEVQILADVAKDQSLFELLQGKLKSEHFRNDSMRLLWDAMMHYGTSTGLLSFHVSEPIKNALRYTLSYPTSGKTQEIAEKLIDTYRSETLRDAMFSVHSESAGKSYEELLRMINFATDKVENVAGCELETKKLSDYADSAFENATKTREQMREEGFSYPWQSVDNMMILSPGSLHLIAAATSKGKSVFANNMLRGVERQGGKSLFFTFEMSVEEVAGRALSGISRTNTRGFVECVTNDPNADIDRLKDARDEMRGFAGRVYDDALIGIDKLCSIVRNHHRKGLCEIVFIDYIGLMEVEMKGFANLSAATSNISKKLKDLAKRLKIPVVALAQLNRKADDDDGAPELKHIADSIGLARDANVVILIDYKESDMMQYMDDYKQGSNPRPFPAWFHVRKNRYGEKGDVLMGYNIESGNFVDWQAEWEYKDFSDKKQAKGFR